MPWTVKFSERDAKCAECGDAIRSYDPRIDWDDDEGEGESKVDWRHRRYCLGCGIPLMEAAEKNVVQRLAQARRVWNQTARRFGRKKIKEKKPAKPQMIKCAVPKCDGMATMIVSIRGQGKVYMCNKKHTFFKETKK